MNIKTLKLREGMFKKNFDFNFNKILIYSDKNSKGKTTLLRFILYSIGYNIPATQKIDFNDFETTIELINNDITYKITRSKNFAKLYWEDKEQTFVLPFELNQLLAKIYGTDNENVLNNLLGTFYFDQEKGWTLLNRGVVIGKNSFYIENLIRGLSNRNCDELIFQANELKSQIDRYKKMYDLSEYKRQIQIDNPEINTNNKALIVDELSKLMNKLNEINKEIDSIDSIIKQNEDFIKYIESSCISVKVPDSDSLVEVNRETIYSFNDNAEFILARKSILLAEKIEITGLLNKQKSKLTKEEQLIETKSLIEEFDSKVMMIDFDQIAVSNIIKKLTKRRNKILKQITEITKQNNAVIEFIYRYVKKYAEVLDMNDIVTADKDFIFTNELKGLSGAILHKLVFIFKMAYLKTVEHYLGLRLPIILDSPSGREVDKDNIDSMFSILNDDFNDYQIIVSSIFNNYSIKFDTTITIINKLMDSAEIDTNKDD